MTTHSTSPTASPYDWQIPHVDVAHSQPVRHAPPPTVRKLLSIFGCDDSTRLWLDLNPFEVATLERVARLTEHYAASDRCMPTLTLADEPEDEWFSKADNHADYLAAHPEVLPADLGYREEAAW